MFLSLYIYIYVDVRQRRVWFGVLGDVVQSFTTTTGRKSVSVFAHPLPLQQVTRFDDPSAKSDDDISTAADILVYRRQRSNYNRTVMVVVRHFRNSKPFPSENVGTPFGFRVGPNTRRYKRVERFFCFETKRPFVVPLPSTAVTFRSFIVPVLFRKTFSAAQSQFRNDPTRARKIDRIFVRLFTNITHNDSIYFRALYEGASGSPG